MKEFEGILENNPQIKNLDAVVGFLRASGYFTLRPFLDNMNKVRILIGIDVDKYIAKAHQRGEIFFGAEEQVKEECLRMAQHRKTVRTKTVLLLCLENISHRCLYPQAPRGDIFSSSAPVFVFFGIFVKGRHFILVNYISPPGA